MQQKNKEEMNNTTAMVYQLLRKRITENRYPTNTRFNQNELAEQLNVSRTPVVKALHMLETDGLVDNIPQRGFFIHQVTLHEMIELFMMRQSIEIITSANAAETATPKQIERLETFFASFVNSTEPINAQEYYKKDRDFHDYLFSLCKNRLLSKMNESLQILTRTYLGGLLRSPEETLREHLELIEAIRQHEVQRAQILAMQHIDVTRKRMKQIEERLTAIGINASKIPIQDFEKYEVVTEKSVYKE